MKNAFSVFILCLFSFCICGQLKTQSEKPHRQPVVFYRDTTVVSGPYAFAFRECYSKALFFKTKLYITNNTDNYLRFDQKDLWVETEHSKKYRIHRRAQLAVVPHGTARYKLRCDGFKLNRDQILFGIDSAWITGNVAGRYQPIIFRLQKEVKAKAGNLEFEVVKTIHGNNGLHVWLRISNLKKDGFLGIDFSKIYIKMPDGSRVYNDVEDFHRYHQVRENDRNLLVFRIPKYVQTDGYIYFEDVFTEYSLQPLDDFKLSVYLDEEE